MRKRIGALVLLLAILLTSINFSNIVYGQEVEAGRTFYVSSKKGNDTNDGLSKEKPFRTLSKINEIELKGGDKVLLEAGSIFNDQFLHIKGSGEEGMPIVIDRYNEGPAPIINTNGKGVWYQDYGMRLDNINHKYKGNVSSSILLFDVEYIEIRNLEITNDPQDPNEIFNKYDKMNRTGVAAVSKDKGTLNHIHLINLYIHDVNGNVQDKHMLNGGIYMSGFKPTDEKATGPAKFDDVLIEGCTVENVRR